PVDRDAALERLDDLFPVSRARLLDALRPQFHAHILRHSEIADVTVVLAELGAEALEERLVGRRVDLLEIVVADEAAFAELRRHAQLLARLSEGLGRDRDVLLEAGAGPLAVERGMRRADEGVDDEVRLCRLDLADRRPELRNVEREEL